MEWSMSPLGIIWEHIFLALNVPNPSFIQSLPFLVLFSFYLLIDWYLVTFSTLFDLPLFSLVIFHKESAIFIYQKSSEQLCPYVPLLLILPLPLPLFLPILFSCILLNLASKPINKQNSLSFFSLRSFSPFFFFFIFPKKCYLGQFYTLFVLVFKNSLHWGTRHTNIYLFTGPICRYMRDR